MLRPLLPVLPVPVLLLLIRANRFCIYPIPGPVYATTLEGDAYVCVAHVTIDDVDCLS